MRLNNLIALSPSHSKQQGFTLIELVAVIVLLGILAVIALPKFINLSDDAHLAVVQGTAGALQIGVKNIEALSQVTGVTQAQRDVPGSFNDDVEVNSRGFPLGTSLSNGQLNNEVIATNSGNNDFGCSDIWTALLTNPPSTSRTIDGSDYQIDRHTNGQSCSFVYRKNGDVNDRTSALLGILYDSTDGTVVVCGSSVTGAPSC
ncbi:type II secretion system protein [Oceanicoccus sagamiensis]|uniref:Prepilin-type N-terminal cleavage/methylation domain-containing protein n=1 Tax=Oceanicoccus sagamiensis TaxID=716816 RepID=A0A1X9NCB5_9GAMM|nr:prepilin-type N-terminal cleavage/methylation domain-containing protein [Oceanicoccus sagamiensis]ARN73179.1 hypothetical protein BST96_03100 [Oceanicoccus sagamiensis]